jgi:hypothetical protein
MTPEEKLERKRALARERCRRYRLRNPGKAAKESAEWRANNPEQSKASVLAWRAKNSERHKQAQRRRSAKWAKNNPEKQRAAIADWNTRNAERNRASARARYQRNTAAGLAKFHRRNARKKAATLALFPVTAEVIAERLALTDGCCYCGQDRPLEVEHVVALNDGGWHIPSNILGACRSCNSSKRDNPVEQWFRAQPFFSEDRWQLIQELTK